MSEKKVSAAMTAAPQTESTSFPDPTPEMLSDPLFNVIWERIKGWDIGAPEFAGGLHTGAMGNHARAILDAIRGAPVMFRDGDPFKYLPESMRAEQCHSYCADPACAERCRAYGMDA